MPRLLATVLDHSDFDQAELTALVLDGDVYRVGASVSPLDEVPGPVQRAAAALAELPSRLIAEQHTAAWVWGAQQRPPRRHEVCSNAASRTRPSFDAGLRVREVVLLPEDTTKLAGLVLTTPMRTALDLVRFVQDWNERETAVVVALMRVGGFGALDCAIVLNRRRNLPGKRTALERLALCQAAAAD